MERRLKSPPRAEPDGKASCVTVPGAVRTAMRLVFAASIAIALACGIAAGLARLGVPLPRHALSNAAWHGVLVLPVFFGSVVSLERAVALGGGRHFLAPVAAASAGLTLLAGAPPVVAQLLLVAGATVALTSMLGLLRRQKALHLAVLALGVLSWWFGNVSWLATGTPLLAVPSWLAFLVLTIASERLELTRMRPTPARARSVFLAIVAVMLVAVATSPIAPDLAPRAFAASLFALAAWLTRYDIARVTIRQRGLTRFIAVCLLSGYGWLALSGVLGLFGVWNAAHPWHDAALHALTLGFVVSMALGHAPIVLPAVAGVRVRYSPLFYVPLIALHAALAVRVSGSLAHAFTLLRAGALGNAAALALFALVMATAARAARGKSKPVSTRR